ncbi:hypothetical protein [Floridanema evergladense]|uniref:Uncharacterized protein n=1 Tax=Floridaenema evergladense BLCC-F167 TaxID=3153639 RepID=A0ABV4WVX6_9CYAN
MPTLAVAIKSGREKRTREFSVREAISAVLPGQRESLRYAKPLCQRIYRIGSQLYPEDCFGDDTGYFPAERVRSHCGNK